MRLFLLLLLSTPSLAQQSLFNVPALEVTPPGEVFFQQQIGMTADAVQSNSAFCVGVTRWLELGADLYNLDLNFDKAQSSPVAAASMLIAFPVHRDVRVGGGLLFGSSLGGPVVAHTAGFAYVEGVYTLRAPVEAQFYFGLFGGTPNFMSTASNVINFMAGLDLRITKRWHFVADHVHGEHGLGNSVIGFAWYPKNTLALSIGAQLPNRVGPSLYGVVFELSLLPGEEITAPPAPTPAPAPAPPPPLPIK